uniref:Uncharacterized protein n=1 Tax=Anguilla anguilla TaxID=7936 RepID=A0A0E9S517_ANGAN
MQGSTCDERKDKGTATPTGPAQSR